MNYLRISLAALVFVCAYVAVADAARGSWRNIPQIQEFLEGNPRARRMTQGPIGGIIDIIIDIILILLSILLGDGTANFQSLIAK